MNSSNGTNGSQDYTVSMVRSAIDTETTNKSSRDLLEGIANGRWHDQVQTVRNAFATGGKAAADAPKKRLPAIMWSGTFSRRAGEALLKHSGLICVDLDKLDDQVEAIRDLICTDEHTLACFISPTGTGLKVLFRCDPEREHIASFRAAEHFVFEHFGIEIDKACKDVARLCFVSCDPDAFVAENATPIPYPPEKVEFMAPVESKPGSALLAGLHPGDDYDLRADVPALLTTHGWKKFGQFGWTRPGKENGISATWNKVPGRFYVFSSEAPPFEPNHVYRPWHIFALLECGGVWKEAAKKLGEQGFGAQLAKRESEIPPDDLAKLDAEHEETELASSRDIVPDDPESEKGSTTELVARKFSDFELPPPGDDSILIGDRWICRGDSVIISSTSGMGKSSLALQMAVCWALCLPFMGGLKPARPLRSLFLQAEDSDGDIAEVKLSIFHEMKLSPADQALVGERVLIITDRIHRGESFLMELRTKVELHKPDFVWINPLLAFLDGDINEAQAAGKFLREGLNSINHPPRFAYCTIHHTAKPPKEKQDRKWNEVMYDMAGSSDLTNWARAIISLRPNETEGEFTMVFAKRGYRAGYKKKVPGKINPGMLFDEPTITIGVKHSKERMQVNGHDLRVIFWEPCPLPGESDTKRMGRPRIAEFEDFNSMWPTSQDASKGFRQLHRLATEIKPTIGRSAFSRIIEDAVEAQKLVIDSRVPGQPKYHLPAQSLIPLS